MASPTGRASVFFALLLVTLLVAVAVAAVVAWAFDRSVGAILARIVADEVSRGWQRFVRFALLVVGVSSGVRIYDLERYLESAPERAAVLTTERWVLEVYRTVIGALQGVAWALLLFFMAALIAYVLVRRAELKRPEPPAAA